MYKQKSNKQKPSQPKIAVKIKAKGHAANRLLKRLGMTQSA